MPLIQRPDVALKLRDRYGLVSLPDSILAPELVPVVIIDDLSSQGMTRRCSGFASQGAVAGEYPMCGLLSAPEVTLHLTRVMYRGNILGNQLQACTLLQDLASWTSVQTSKAFRDLSIPGQPSGNLAINSLPAAPLRRIFNVLRLPVDSTGILDLDITVNPTDIGVMFLGPSVNMALEVSFDWEELPPV